MANDSQTAKTATPEVAQIAAAVTAVVTVFAGLAVTGALSNTQRNHGVYLFIAFALVLLGAVLWFTAVLIPANTEVSWRIIQIPDGPPAIFKLATVRWVLQLLGATFCDPAGNVIGVWQRSLAENPR
jgi:hypothetical protein